MESTAFFEKKFGITPSDFNKIKRQTIEELLLDKARQQIENKCSEHGFVLPGSIKLISRSMGRFEDGNKTGEAVNYVKLEGKVVYPADGIRIVGEVIRKNKMGLYVDYKKAIRVQVPRDLHIGSEEYESVEVGDKVEVELKRSKFQINDLYILSSGLFVAKKTNVGSQLNTKDNKIEDNSTPIDEKKYNQTEEVSNDDDAVSEMDAAGERENEEEILESEDEASDNEVSENGEDNSQEE